MVNPILNPLSRKHNSAALFLCVHRKNNEEEWWNKKVGVIPKWSRKINCKVELCSRLPTEAATPAGGTCRK